MGARELLHELVDAGFTIEADRDKLVIWPASKLTDEIRAALRQAKPELMVLLSAPTTAMNMVLTTAMNGRPYRLSQAEADAAHAEPWTDAACGRFVARVSLFLRRQVNATDADDLAERLHLRDVRGDDRVLCLECKHLTGRRCGNADVAGVGRDLPAGLTTQMQRCPGFRPEGSDHD